MTAPSTTRPRWFPRDEAARRRRNERLARTVVCPCCCAAALSPCVGEDGVPLDTPHRDRIKAGRRARYA